MHEDILDYNYEEGYQEPSFEYAGFLIRVGASFIDALVFIPLGILNTFNAISIKSLPLEFVILIVSLGYKPFLEHQYGGTLGKMALKIRVVDVQGGPLQVTQAIIRSIPFLLVGAVSALTTLAVHLSVGFGAIESLAEYNLLMSQAGYSLLSNLVNGFFIISCLLVAFHPKRQALHDMMAQTYCIHH